MTSSRRRRPCASATGTPRRDWSRSRSASPTILDLALVRYHPDGTLDTGFDGDGILTADFHGSGEFGQDVTLDTDGRIVAAGYTANGSDTEFALVRANP